MNNKRSHLAKSAAAMIAAAVAAAAVAIVPNAFADRERMKDPADATEPRLDVRVISHGHKRAQKRRFVVVHGIETHEAWQDDLLASGASIRFAFYTDADPAVDREVIVRTSRRGRLKAGIKNEAGKVMEYAEVWRPDDRSLKIALPPRFLRDRDFDGYRWFVETNLASGFTHCTTPQPAPTTSITATPGAGGSATSGGTPTPAATASASPTPRPSGTPTSSPSPSPRATAEPTISALCVHGDFFSYDRAPNKGAVPHVTQPR